MSSGYGFVPLPDQIRRVERPQISLDRRIPGTLDVALDLRLITEQPLHLGSGGLHMGTRLVRDVVRSGGQVIIPGSSLRGAVRTRFEGITLSCVALREGRIRDRISTKSRSRPEIKWASVEQAELQRLGESCRSGGDLCPTCALFGLTSQRGRITLSDVVPVGQVIVQEMDMPLRFSPRFHHVGEGVVRGDTYIIQGLHGRKLARGKVILKGAETERVEVIPVGATFAARVALRGVTPEELGAVLIAVGAREIPYLKMGGGRGLGFGRVRVELASWKVSAFRAPGQVSTTPEDMIARFRIAPDFHPAGMAALIQLHNKEC